ncbi:hypothetical protein ACM0P6_02060 [Komagataeibacter sucrofermentans]|uniref:hypothetical protein n=1 Tax=Komagataeibacter sucrofermentans TaxID=1053551 RepID=UPI0011B60CF0|nr:hypothetical protein [Komagataeibacter sucrofermentans]
MLKNRAGSKYSFQKTLSEHDGVRAAARLCIMWAVIVLRWMVFADVLPVFMPFRDGSRPGGVDTELSGYVSYT